MRHDTTNRIWSHAIAIAIAWTLVFGVGRVEAQNLGPTATVTTFYRMLREEKYTDGLALSVYREAIEGLGAEDLAELSSEFRRTFTDIPAAIEVRGEQVSGDTATVYAVFEAGGAVQEVALVREDGRWLVGDTEALELVRRERTLFFFNARIEVSHNEVFGLLRRIIGSQDLFHQARGRYATIEELAALDAFGGELKDGVASGYRFTMRLGPENSTFGVEAIPLRYGRSGRLSFYATTRSIHADDVRGGVVDGQAPLLVDDVFASPKPAP